MIFKFQQGGGMYVPPLVSYLPVTITGDGSYATAASSAESSGKSSDLTDKDLLLMMEKLDGLPSDMKAITDTLTNFYIEQLYSPFKGGTANIASRYLQALLQMRTANFNKKEYDNAFDIVSKNGGIDEFAVSDRGMLYCFDGNTLDFKLIRPEDLKDHPDYLPLTNSELLRYRAYIPDLAFNSNILSVVRNGIGMNAVLDMIKGIINGIGTDLDKLGGYTITNSGEVLTGIKDLTQAIMNALSQGVKFNGNLQDLYKYDILNSEQTNRADMALKYIYRALPANAKALLKTRTNSGTDEEAYELIGTLIASQISSNKQFDMDLEAGKTASAKAKASEGKDTTDLKTSLPLNIMQAIGGYEQTMTLDRGDGILMSVNGTYYQQIKTPNGDPIIDTSLKDMLANSGLQSIVENTKNITFGDLKLSMDQLGNITYNNTGVIRANLPVKADGSVDLEILERYQQAENAVKLLGTNPNPEQVAQIMQEYLLDELLDSSGRLNPKKFAPFIVTEGYTTAKNGIKDSSYVKKIDATDQQIELIKKSLAVGTGKDKLVPDIDTFDWYNPFDWFGIEDIYKAAIYIPISNNQASAAYGSNQKLDYDEASELERKYRNFNKTVGLSSTSADVL